MSTIYVARGVGRAPTRLASYDAALADVGLHDYNLVSVSSVIPAEASVERVDRAPDLGPAGNRLTVVQARATVGGNGDGESVAAGLGWATGPGAGLFYEAAGDDAAGVADAIETGLDAGCDLRDRAFTHREVTVATADAPADGYATAVAVAAYGRSEPVF